MAKRKSGVLIKEANDRRRKVAVSGGSASPGPTHVPLPLLFICAVATVSFMPTDTTLYGGFKRLAGQSDPPSTGRDPPARHPPATRRCTLLASPQTPAGDSAGAQGAAGGGEGCAGAWRDARNTAGLEGVCVCVCVVGEGADNRGGTVGLTECPRTDTEREDGVLSVCRTQRGLIQELAAWTAGGPRGACQS